jgi:hypothetical protein
MSRERVQIIEIKKDWGYGLGSSNPETSDKRQVLVYPRGKTLKGGDPCLGVHSICVVKDVYEKDPFDTRIYSLSDGSTLVNPQGFICEIGGVDLSNISHTEKKDLGMRSFYMDPWDGNSKIVLYETED